MEEEIQHLLDQDIIKNVNEPTGWVSPPVVTPKKDQSQIRLNVDMRVANQAIPRQAHPALHDRQRDHRAKRDDCVLTFGYGQRIPPTRAQSGFEKRLNYGTRSVAEIFQETIREELTQDLKGVFSVSDDIIVHGRDTKEHDENLEALLKKSREKNITFNKAKCEFNKNAWSTMA